MSDLPQIDALRVAERIIQKRETEIERLNKLLGEAATRESQLEILAETLRDQRDALHESLTDENEEATDEVNKDRRGKVVDDN